MEINELYELFQQTGKISTDSRNIIPGSMFFALKGERFDGNVYAAEALKKGAAYAIVDNPDRAGQPNCILVGDALVALQQMARYHRRQFHIPIIAITGSNGKTTTKELVSAVLSSHYQTHFTRGNYNNHIGVPLTLLAMPEDAEVAIIEMGANAQGEIGALCRIAEPTHGVITNIGKAHLEGFGGIEGVKKGKSELYRYLAERKGTVFINQEEPFLRDLAKSVQKKVFYGLSKDLSPEHAPIEINLLQEQPFLSVAFLNESGALTEVHSQLIGRYNLGNLITAIALGKYFKVPSARIKEAIEGYVPQMNRSQLVQAGGCTYILDAYNANPSSMEQALLNFAAMEGKEKVAVLGAMYELGEDSLEEHAQIARLAHSLPLHRVLLVGTDFASIAAELGLSYFPDTSALKAWLFSQSWKSGTLFLVKGSRAMQMEQLLRAD